MDSIDDDTPNDKDAFSEMLERCVDHGSTTLFKLLMTSDTARLADVEDFAPALFSCARRDRVELLSRILRLRSDWSKIFASGELVLSAMLRRSTKVLRALARAGASLDIPREKLTLLALAADNADVPMCSELLDCGANPNGAPDPAMQMFSPLFCAVRSDSVEAAEMLLDAGADPNVLNLNDMTALDCLAMARHNRHNPLVAARRLAIANKLLEAGARADRTNLDGYNALHLACQCGNTSLAALLISRGCDPRAPDIDGIEPLRRAISSNNEDTASMLIEHGAPTTRDEWERLLSLAKRAGMPNFSAKASSLFESWTLNRLTPELAGASARSKFL